MNFRHLPRFLLGFCFISVLIVCKTATAIDVFVTAVAGQPYGVATIEIPVVPPVLGQELPPIEASDVAGRVLYPFSENIRVDVPPPSERPVPPPGNGRLLGRVGSLIRELTNKDQDLQQTVARRVTFLFVGADPLEVRIRDIHGEIGVYPVGLRDDAIAHQELVALWWKGYTDAAQRQIRSADYPALVETYLVAMLAGRMNLALPTWYTESSQEGDELINTLKLIAGAGGASEAIFRRAAAALQSDSLPADLPLPPPPAWAPLFTEDDLAGVPVESIARRVPPECFYIRYGSFANYLWFRDLSDEYGGDLSRMVTLRGVENDAAQRVENQLNVKTTEMSRMLGPSVIEDQAIIGRDLYMGDGASIGVLFHAKNAFLLRTSLIGDRRKLASDDTTVTLKDIKISGSPATLLSSADNRVRSFMVEDGDYILVTNSRTLAGRFLDVGKTSESLAASSAFQLSRQLMPLERDDTIFAYFSPEMLRGLVAPEYLIELRRRLSAKAEVTMVHLARLAAAQEQRAEKVVANNASPSDTSELIELGFLPARFGQRHDGSGVVSVGNEVIDSMRGTRGTFLPIADARIDSVTAEEAAWYRRIADESSRRFPTLDPIAVGIQRQAVDDAPGIERIVIHAEVAPWGPEKYGKWAQQLGPPTRVAMRFAPDDIIAAQAHVASEQIGPPTHLFAAIKDTVPPKPDEFEGILNIYRSLRSIPGYLGAWPQPGALDRLPLGLGRGQPVGPGMSRLIGGLYRYSDGQYSILSFQPEVLHATLPFLVAEDVDDTAQVRVRIGNLRGSQIERWANELLYDRAKEGSEAGANFLNLLTEQLSVEPQEVPSVAGKILGASLQCPLGGQYTHNPQSGRWSSTAWHGEFAPLVAPIDFVAPAMTWFRGSSATLTQYADRLVADAVIDIRRK